MGGGLDKIFFLNLDSRKERWENLQLYKINHPNLERFSAIDSIKNPFVFKDYHLELNPVGIDHTLYFSFCYGAVGCYLSHYLMWKQIVENKWENVLILEDDIESTSLQSFLLKFKESDYKGYDLVQLSCKNKFGGTEAYWLNYKAAQVLLEVTHDSSPLSKIIPLKSSTKKLIKQGLIEENIFQWGVKNSITSPSDKFLEYVAKSGLVKFKRKCGIRLDINLCNNSSIAIDPNFKKIKNTGMVDYINHEKYKWWEK